MVSENMIRRHDAKYSKIAIDLECCGNYFCTVKIMVK